MQRARWTCAALLVLLVAGTAFAVDQAVAAATGQSSGDSLPLGKRLLNGVLGGIIAALIGWAKNRDLSSGSQEKFEFKYGLMTVIVGAVAGLIAGFLGKSLPDFFSSYESLPIYGLAVTGVEMLWKAIFRQSTFVIKDALGMVKTGSENPPPPPSPNP